jgi:DNA polymerase elongation subunit (family B)
MIASREQVLWLTYVLTIFLSSERALLNRLMLELHKLDTDVLVGHNISGFDLDVLLHRSQVGISASQTIASQL